jgi:hypothetical protein
MDLADEKQVDKTQPNGKRFVVFPSWRMQHGFPWTIWAVGWMAIFKAFLWLSTDPNVAGPTAEILAAKFICGTIPFAVLGVGVWNLRRWANWGIIGLAAADLLFFIIFPNATRQLIGGSHWLLAIALLVCNGPIGDILILLASPTLIKYVGRQGEFAQETA